MALTLLSFAALLLFNLYSSTDGGDSLYSSSDPLVQMDINSFDRTLVRSPTAWVVEFYATWCGHCQRFAPVYRDFARSVAGWSSVVKVGAVACSDSHNLPVCQRQNIWGYPTVKFFPPNMQSVGRGVKADSLRHNVDSITEITLRFIEERVTRSSSPSLKKYDSLQKLLEKARSSGTTHLFAIVDDGTSTSAKLAKLVIMDMSSSYPDTLVGRLSRSDIVAYNRVSQQLPWLMLIHPQSGRMRFVMRVTDRKSTKQMIESLSSQTWTPDLTTTVLPSQNEGNTGYGRTTTPAPRIPQKLTPSDLESNIHYMLWTEVATHKKIRGTALTALKKYMEVLYKYYPGSERLKSFLGIVTRWLERIDGIVDGELYVNTIEGLQTNESYVSSDLKWGACAGTKPQFRGYPCSLWMTFHAVTVAAYERFLKNPQAPFDPMEVLDAIREYVRHYLGCRECARHFQQMAQYMELEVSHPEDVILWMWNGHNRANNRLHGDPTEDPAYPKVQFPEPALCPTCRYGRRPVDKFDNETDWNIPEVLKFLRNFYAKENIFDYPLTTPSLAALMPTVVPYTDSGPSNRNSQSENTSHNRGASSSLYTKPQRDQSNPRGPSANHAANPSSSSNETCHSQTTAWSPCSRTCDPGVSTRLSNLNDQCEMRLEMRVCQIRPCNFNAADYRIRRNRPGHCSANVRSIGYKTLTFNGCTTVQGYRWRFCNTCPGYCCQPASDGTFWADVTCRSGEELERGLMPIAWNINCNCVPGNC